MSFQIFLKVALTYPLQILAYFIFMAVFLPKAISLPRKPRSQASRSGLMDHVQTPVKKNVVLLGHTLALRMTLLITSMGYRTVSSQNSLSSISFLSARNRDLTTRSSMHDRAPCLLPKLVPTTTQCYPWQQGPIVISESSHICFIRQAVKYLVHVMEKD